MPIKSKITEKSLKKIEELIGSRLTLGKLLWAIRQSEEMNQIDFSKKLRITKQHLCDIEHNRKAISPKLAAEYAQRLNYPKEQFIRLALQDMVNRAKLNVRVHITETRT